MNRDVIRRTMEEAAEFVADLEEAAEGASEDPPRRAVSGPTTTS